MTQIGHESPSRRDTAPTSPPRRRYRPWLRLRFTRERLSALFRSMIWVAPLTVVIWIYAEREQIDQRPAAGVPVRVISSDANWSVQVVGPRTVDLQLRGPLEGLEKVSSALNSRMPPGVQIDLGGSLHAGQNQPINVANHIQDQPLFRSNGVTVESVPPIVEIDIDSMTELAVDVQLPPDLPNVDPGASFEPRQVHVRGPTQLLREMGNHPTVYADLGRLAAKLAPGVQKLSDVPVVVANTSGADRITVLPPTDKVNVQLTVLAADETRRIPSMPVLVLAPSSLTQTYDVHVDPVAVANVDVSGPPDKLDQLEENPPRAMVDVGLGDVGRDSPKSLRFILPDGVHVTPASAQITVRCTLSPRGG